MRLDGVPVGICEVLGLELDEPKLAAFAGTLNALDFPVQLLVRQHPPGPGASVRRPAGNSTAAAAPGGPGGGRIAAPVAHHPGDPGRHPGPALLCQLPAGARRRAVRPADPGRARGPPAAGPYPAAVAAGGCTGRLASSDRLGCPGGGRGQPPRPPGWHAPHAVTAAGPLAPHPGARVSPAPHGRRRAYGPLPASRPHPGGAGRPHPGVAEGALRVGPVPVTPPRPDPLPRGGDCSGGRHQAAGPGAARPGATVPCVALHHPARQGPPVIAGPDPTGARPLRRHPGEVGPADLPPARRVALHPAPGPQCRGRVADPGHLVAGPAVPLRTPGLDTRSGTLYGIDLRACSPVVYDPFDGTHLNANTAVLARSGRASRLPPSWGSCGVSAGAWSPTSSTPRASTPTWPAQPAGASSLPACRGKG